METRLSGYTDTVLTGLVAAAKDSSNNWWRFDIGTDGALNPTSVGGSPPSGGTQPFASVADLNAARTAINVSNAPYSVTPGSTTPEVGIQLALDQANTNALAGSGPTVVYVPPGTYSGMDIHRVPGDTNLTYASLWLYSNVTLWLAPGAVLKIKNQLTIPAGGVRAWVIATYGGWRFPSAGGYRTRNAKIIGGVIDCNGLNHHATSQSGSSALFDPGEVITEAIQLAYATDSGVYSTTVKNLYGTNQGPPGETFGIATWYCRDCTIDDCRVYADDGSTAATGFSDGYSFGTRFNDCVAHDCAEGMGFTSYLSAHGSYSNCHAYKCPNGSGFNAELSNHLTYSACVAGGRTPDYTLMGNPNHPDWQSGQAELSCNLGWSISGCSFVEVGDDCQSFYNGAAAYIYSNTGPTPDKPNDHISFRAHIGFIGSSPHTVDTSGASNITVERASDGAGKLDQTEVHVDCVMNTVFGTGRYVLGTAPVVQYEATNGASGVRHVTKSKLNYGQRWFRQLVNNSTVTLPDLAISASGQVATAGRLKRVTTAATNYTVLPTDEVILCTGTATTAQTITLPTAADGTFDSDGSSIYGVGRTITVVNDAGGPYAITIVANGSQTIGGQAKPFVTNGTVILASNGTGWDILSSTAPLVDVPFTGQKAVADMLLATAPASAVTPTYNTTGFGNNSDAANSNIASGVAVAWNDPRVTTIGGTQRLYGGGTAAYTTNPFGAVAVEQAAAGFNRAGTLWGVAFEYEGQAFETKIYGNTAQWFTLWTFEAGQWRPHATTPTAVTKSDGLQYLLKFDFGSRAKRQIFLEWEGWLYAGLRIEPTATLTPLKPGPRMLVIGDSYSVPGMAQFRSAFGYVPRMARRLGILDVVINGYGGTGFVNDGAGVSLKYLDRLNVATTGTFAAYPARNSFDLIFVQGSINEETLAGNASVDTAVDAIFKALRDRYSAPIFTSSPMLPSKNDTTANGQDATLRTQIAAAATKYQIPMFDALTADNAKFQYGTGRQGATTGDGNADFNAFTDGRHLSPATALGLGNASGANSVGDRLAAFAVDQFNVVMP